MTVIKPTVGRVLHFFPTAQYMASRHLAFGDPSQPLAAMITYVHGDTMVNLTVWDQNGLQFGVCSVPLVQEGARSGGSFYAEWMPYQKGQAAKADELQVKADVLTGPARPFGQSDKALEHADYVRDRAASEAMADQALANVTAAASAFSHIIDGAPGRDEVTVRLFLPMGMTVKVEGIPLQLEHDAVVVTHPCNVPLIFPPKTARPAESSE